MSNYYYCDACEDTGIVADSFGEDCVCVIGESFDSWSDADYDADALAGIGWGTDEDYGYYGDEY